MDGDTYENSGEVYDYIKKETANGYKLFVIYDVVHRIPIYFEVHPMNDADGPKLTKMIEKSMEITGRRIKRMYVDRGFYDETNFGWWREEKEGKKKIEFVTMGKRGTYLFKKATELEDDKFRALRCFVWAIQYPLTSAEADHRMDISNAKFPLLSKCPRFHHQDIYSIGYLNHIPPT